MVHTRSYGRLAKLKTLKRKETQLAYIKDRLDDELFMELLNILLNPDYKKARLSKLTCEGTVQYDTSVLLQVMSDDTLSVTEYINSLSADSTDILESIFNSELSITHKDVIALRLEFTSNLRNLNELPALYGAPSFPCYVQFVPEDVTYYNIHFGHYITKVLTKDGLSTAFPSSIFKDLRRIDFVGRAIGYLDNGVFIVTNVYPIAPVTLEERFSSFEVALNKSKAVSVALSRLAYVGNMYDVKEILPSTEYIALFKADTVPKYGRSQNVIAINSASIARLI